jgi:rubrerythrin
MGNSKTGKDDIKLVDVLNQALKLEYSFVVYYPRLANAVKDEKARELVLQLGTDSIHHADMVADAITESGGEPDWYFELYPEDKDIITIFKEQLEKEKMAMDLHQLCANMMSSNELKEKFIKIALEEVYHIQSVDKILEILTANQQKQ